MEGQEHARETETPTEHDPMAEMENTFENLCLDVNGRVSESIDPLIGQLRELDLHLLKPVALDKSMVLKCIHLQYDTDKVNLDEAQINTEGDLVNRRLDTTFEVEGKLKKYSGTCSTEPLLPLGCPQYWETETNVTLNKSLVPTDFILELGVSADDERDKDTSIAGRNHTYSLAVGSYPNYRGITSKVRREHKNAKYDSITMNNKEKESAILHYGVVYDDARKKIVFIDVKENKVMATFKEVESGQSLWPMFGVSSSAKSTVSMRLVVGKDIIMTEEKKAMIDKALRQEVC